MSTSGVYAVAEERDYRFDGKAIRLKVGKGDGKGGVEQRLKDHRCAATYPLLTYRVYECERGQAFDHETRIHRALKLAGKHIKTDDMGFEIFNVTLRDLDSVAKAPGMWIQERWVHPKDRNKKWPRHVKLAAYYWMISHTTERGPKHLVRELHGVLGEAFPSEMEAVNAGKIDGGVQALGQRFQMMYDSKTSPTEHPNNWVDTDEHLEILVGIGWPWVPPGVLLDRLIG